MYHIANCFTISSFIPFHLSPFLIVISTSLQIVHSFLYSIHINHICLFNSSTFPSLSHMWLPLSLAVFLNIAVTSLLTEPIWQMRPSYVEHQVRTLIQCWCFLFSSDSTKVSGNLQTSQDVTLNHLDFPHIHIKECFDINHISPSFLLDLEKKVTFVHNNTIKHDKVYYYCVLVNRQCEWGNLIVEE
jgi:hypothetical protein